MPVWSKLVAGRGPCGATFADLVVGLKRDYQVAEVGLDVFFADEVKQEQRGDRQLTATLQQYLPGHWRFHCKSIQTMFY